MMLDKANRKSIRLNGYEKDTLRIYLAKMANANDCDDLFGLLSTCIENIKTRSQHDVDREAVVSSPLSTAVQSSQNEIFNAQCTVEEETAEDEPIDCCLYVLKDGIEFFIKLQSNDDAGDRMNLYSKLDAITAERRSGTIVFKGKQLRSPIYVHIENSHLFEKFLDIYYDNISNLEDKEFNESSGSSTLSSKSDYDNEKNTPETSAKRVFADEEDDDKRHDEQNSKKAKIFN